MADVTDTYYAGQAFTGWGTQLLVSTPDGVSPQVFEAVADVIDIQPGAMSADVVEKTHLRSPNRHREWKATLRNSEPFTVMCNWRPAHESQSRTGGGTGAFQNGGLLKMHEDLDERDFKIVLSDTSPGTEWPFRGTIIEFTPGGIVGDQKVDLTLRIQPLQSYSADLP